MSYTIRISGTILSSLLFECANTETDIEGFLLGALSFKTTLTNDDSAQHAFEKREDFIIIHGYQILKEKPYDAQGNLIKSSVKSQQKDITSLVGYFKFRRQTDVALSIRDQLFMKSYSTNIPHGCIAILSSNLNSFTDKSTQTYEFAFWDMKNETDRKLPIDITNMTESTLQYKKFMSNAPYKPSDASSNDLLAQVISPDTITNQFDGLYKAAIDALQKSTNTVAQKETELLALRKEIEELEKSKQIF